MDGIQLSDEAVRDRIRAAEEFLDPRTYRRHEAGEKGVEGCKSYRGARVLREEIRREKIARHARVQLGVPVVRRLDHGELKATGVLEVQVDLAVLAAVRLRRAGPNVRLETVEAKGNDLQEKHQSQSHALSARKTVPGKLPLTVRSGDTSFVTVPWGHPLPEVEELTIWISSGDGLSPWATVPRGVAATRTGASRAA